MFRVPLARYTLLTLLLTSCSSELAESDVQETTDELTGVTPSLGAGYDSVTQTYKAVCAYSATPLRTGTQEAVLSGLRVVSQQEAQSTFDARVDVSARYLFASASASVETSESMRTDRYSEAVVFSNVFNLGAHQLHPQDVQLTVVGRNALSTGRFREVCGDEVVYQAQIGAAIYIVARLDFDTEQSRSEFRAAMSGSVNFGIASASLDARFKSTYAAFARRMRLSIYAYQYGGHAANIGNTLNGLGTNVSGNSGDGVRAFLSCGPDNVAACETFLAQAATYATAGEQVANSFAHGTIDRPAEISFQRLRWVDYPLSETISTQTAILDTQISQARTELERKFANAARLRPRVLRLRQGVFATPPDYNARLDAVLAEIDTAYRTAALAADACYSAVRFDPTGQTTAASILACNDAVALVPDVQVADDLLETGASAFIFAEAMRIGYSGSYGPLHVSPDGQGWFQDFAEGGIYWDADHGAMAIPGPMRDGYHAWGGFVGQGKPTELMDLGGGSYALRVERSLLTYNASDRVTYATWGAILERYNEQGGPFGWLGIAESTEGDYAGGRISSFANGAVMWNGAYGAFAMPSEQFFAMERRGGPNTIGWPNFQGWRTRNTGWFTPLSTNANLETYYIPGSGGGPADRPRFVDYVVAANMLAKWSQHGAEHQWLGYPISDAYNLPNNGRRQDFQGGRIVEYPWTGAMAMPDDIARKYDANAQMLGFPRYEGGEIVRGGRYFSFDHGVIYRVPASSQLPNGGVFYVVEPALTTWGNQDGCAGYPVIDTRANGTQHFERGQVFQAFLPHIPYILQCW